MLIHPQFDPIALQFGPLAIRWYGLMYLIGFGAFFFLGRMRARRDAWRGINEALIDDLLFFGVLGVILGGRLGYILFYKPVYYLSHPLEIFMVWQGGMAFHGGFLGVLVAMALVARKHQLSWLAVTDFIAPLVPLGLASGRLGNFINGELWGRTTDVAWGVVFPLAGPVPRHPSQIYEAGLEGILLGLLLIWAVRRGALKRPWLVSGLFGMGYGLARIASEFFREPDPQLGFLLGGATMGMLLSLPLVLIGLALVIRAMRRPPVSLRDESPMV